MKITKSEEHHTKMLLFLRTFLNHFKIWHRCIQKMDKVHFFSEAGAEKHSVACRFLLPTPVRKLNTAEPQVIFHLKATAS